jgi:hypothetical protein
VKLEAYGCACAYHRCRTDDVHTHYAHYLHKKEVRRRCQRAADARRAGRKRDYARYLANRRLRRKMNIMESACSS